MGDKKVIWITGASSGIGRALAIKFANEGWIVAASARRENLLQELNKINQNIYSFPLDVTNIDQCKSVFKNIIEKFNDVEISIFGTGIHDPKSEKEFNLDKIRKIIEEEIARAKAKDLKNTKKSFSKKQNRIKLSQCYMSASSI